MSVGIRNSFPAEILHTVQCIECISSVENDVMNKNIQATEFQWLKSLAGEARGDWLELLTLTSTKITAQYKGMENGKEEWELVGVPNKAGTQCVYEQIHMSILKEACVLP